MPQHLIKEAKSHELRQKQIEVEYDPECGIQRLLPQTTPDFMQTPLDYLGRLFKFDF